MKLLKILIVSMLILLVSTAITFVVESLSIPPEPPLSEAEFIWIDFKEYLFNIQYRYEGKLYIVQRPIANDLSISPIPLTYGIDYDDSGTVDPWEIYIDPELDGNLVHLLEWMEKNVLPAKIEQ